MNWVELADHLIEEHGESAHLIDQLDSDACRNVHRQLHTYLAADHRHEDEAS